MARTDPRPHYGTKRRVGVGGYIDIYEPSHPLARRDGYVSEHRKIAWDAGVLTDRSRQIHHVNGDKLDNRLDNLHTMTCSEHTRMHWEGNHPTHCPQGHLYDEANTWFSKEGWRACRTCNRERQRARFGWKPLK